MFFVVISWDGRERASICSCMLGTFLGGGVAPGTLLWVHTNGAEVPSPATSQRRREEGPPWKWQLVVRVLVTSRKVLQSLGGEGRARRLPAGLWPSYDEPDTRGRSRRVRVALSSPPYPVCRDSPAPTVPAASAPSAPGSVLVTTGVCPCRRFRRRGCWPACFSRDLSSWLTDGGLFPGPHWVAPLCPSLS